MINRTINIKYCFFIKIESIHPYQIYNKSGGETFLMYSKHAFMMPLFPSTFKSKELKIISNQLISKIFKHILFSYLINNVISLALTVVATAMIQSFRILIKLKNNNYARSSQYNKLLFTKYLTIYLFFFNSPTSSAGRVSCYRLNRHTY